MGTPQPPFSNSAPASAAGAAAVQFLGRSNNLVKVVHVGVECSTAVGAVGALRRNGWLESPFNPVGDALEGEPVYLWPGDTLTAEWTGAPAGAVCKASFRYELEPL